MKYAFVLMVLSLSSGCALNAVLEINMDLPYDAAAGDRPYALVEVLRGPVPELCPPDPPPDLDCFDPDFPIAAGYGFLIDGTEPNLCDDLERDCNVRVSTLSENVDLEAVHVRVNLCNSEDCIEIGDARPPYYLFEIAHPFYRGEVTRWSPNRSPFAWDMLSPQPQGMRTERRYDAHRCEVEGCFGGNVVDDASLGWCRGLPDDKPCGRAGDTCLEDGSTERCCDPGEVCVETFCQPCTDINCRQNHFCGPAAGS